MENILTGIGKIIGALWGVEPKPLDESIEEKINKALAEEMEKIKPSRKDIDTFSWITKDNNPVHRLKERAIKLGFEKIPLMGAHVSAYGEQFIERVVENMKEYWGADIKIIGQDNEFRKSVGLRNKIRWQVTGYKPLDNEIKLNISGSVKNIEVITIKSHLAKDYKLMPQIAGPILNSSRKYLFEEEHLDSFYQCVSGKNKGSIPNMLPASLVPATLLSLLEEKTQTMEGMNLSMNFDFLNKAHLGRLQVDLYPPRKPKLKPRINKETEKPAIDSKSGKEIIDYLYKFKSVVSQETKPITYVEIIVSAPYFLEF